MDVLPQDDTSLLYSSSKPITRNGCNSYPPQCFVARRRACFFFWWHWPAQRARNGRFSLWNYSVEFREGRLLHRTRRFARPSSSAGRTRSQVLRGGSIVKLPPEHRPISLENLRYMCIMVHLDVEDICNLPFLEKTLKLKTTTCDQAGVSE